MSAAEGFLFLTVAGLATARTTRLITKDEITAPLRGLAHHYDPGSKHVGFIVTCPYCAGVWAAAGVTGLLALTAATDGWGRWLPAAPVAIMAVAQAGFWLTPRDSDTLNETYMAPWPKGD